MPEEIEGIPLSNPSLRLCFGEIALDDLRRLSVLLDKNNRRGAAAERFNSKCAAAREKIEDPCLHDGIAQAGEDSCFDTVHRRSHTTLRNCQANPAGAAGDHSHGEEAGVGVTVASGSVTSSEAYGEGTWGP